MLPQKFIASLLLLCSLASCGKSGSNKSETKKYTAVNNRDTASMSLTLYENEFYGKLMITKPGKVIDAGEIEGKIVGDTLIGNFFYTQHGWAHKKRKPLALLLKNGKYIQGTGLTSVFMGIPSFVPASISFESPTYVFDEEK